MQNYLRSLQVNCSAGKIISGCRQNLLHVTGGNLLTPERNFHEASIVRACMEFFKPMDVSFFSSSKQLYQVTTFHLLPLKSKINLWRLILFRNIWTAHCWLFNPLCKKYSSLKKLSLRPTSSGTYCCHFLKFFSQTHRGKGKCPVQLSFSAKTLTKMKYKKRPLESSVHSEKDVLLLNL